MTDAPAYVPQHVTAIAGRTASTAPYNFVPLHAKVFRADPAFEAHHVLSKDRLHGYIDLEITTLTPLYCRTAPPPDRTEPREHADAAEPYHHDDPKKPSIPGRSLRGMLRSLVNIIAHGWFARVRQDGKLDRMLDDQLMFRDFSDDGTDTFTTYRNVFGPETKPQSKTYWFPGRDVRAGHLEQSNDGGWQIIPAKADEFSNTFVRVSAEDPVIAGISSDGDGHRLWVRPKMRYPRRPRGKGSMRFIDAITEEVSLSPKPGLKPGRLVIPGETPNRKLHTIVYEPDEKSEPLPISDEVWRRFQRDNEMKRDEKVVPRELTKPSSRNFYSVPDLDGRRRTACFYLIDEKTGAVSAIGPTLYFRMPYPRRTSAFLPGALKGEGPELDLSEALFGVVTDFPSMGAKSAATQDEAALQVKGRVQVEDAMFVGPDRDPRMSGFFVPKMLLSPKPTSYQLYLVQTDRTRPGQGKPEPLMSYASDTRGTVVRGHKRYWHRQDANANLERRDDTTDTETCIRPVLANKQFRGRIKFENLTSLELGALLAAVELDEDCAHKIGLAKSIGLGSIRIDSSAHLWDPRRKYRALRPQHTRQDEEDQRAKLQSAREAFRVAMIAHHNSCVQEPLPPDASLWAIPRLASLRILMRWQGKPSDRRTQQMMLDPDNRVDEFRARRRAGLSLPAPEWVVDPNASSRNLKWVAPATTPERIKPLYDADYADEVHLSVYEGTTDRPAGARRTSLLLDNEDVVELGRIPDEYEFLRHPNRRVRVSVRALIQIESGGTKDRTITHAEWLDRPDEPLEVPTDHEDVTDQASDNSAESPDPSAPKEGKRYFCTGSRAGQRVQVTIYTDRTVQQSTTKIRLDKMTDDVSLQAALAERLIDPESGTGRKERVPVLLKLVLKPRKIVELLEVL